MPKKKRKKKARDIMWQQIQSSRMRCCYTEIQKLTFMLSSVGFLHNGAQCIPSKDKCHYWPLGPKLSAAENKTSLSEANSAKLIIAFSFKWCCCFVTCTWLGRKRTAGSPFWALFTWLVSHKEGRQRGRSSGLDISRGPGLQLLAQLEDLEF